MATSKDLERQVEEMRALLADHGIRPRPEAVPLTERPDYIAHGSDRHAALLGLVEVAEGDSRVTIATYTSPQSGRAFALEDEMDALRHYPGIDPVRAVQLVLQQKCNELEIAPTVPANAQAMFQPGRIY